ncbi:hypothetical protein PMZ80_007948 [Knufia obscura]|uniref:Uncharacterized protein n=1 Tax=Knufia obscura TaxID=1635080 RepID=A0ABR0RG29_9EURO|nr:hypothetical protein PMZ80_007948 [Knufia obscura]
MRNGDIASIIFRRERVDLGTYNNLRLVDRAMSSILPPFSAVADSAEPQQLAPRYLNVSCQNKRFVDQALSRTAGRRDDLFYYANCMSWMARTHDEDMFERVTTVCTNTLASRPDLRFYACNGPREHHYQVNHRYRPNHGYRHPPRRIVCEECVVKDYHETSPLRIGKARVVGLCHQHSEDCIRDDQKFAWTECTCPNDYSPFRYRKWPTWFCSLCALAHLNERQRRWASKLNSLGQIRVRTQDDARRETRDNLPGGAYYLSKRTGGEIRDYVYDHKTGVSILPRACERNRCTMCTMNNTGPGPQEPGSHSGSWKYILESYPMTDWPGIESFPTQRDYSWTYRLCADCLQHVPEKDLDREAVTMPPDYNVSDCTLPKPTPQGFSEYS